MALSRRDVPRRDGNPFRFVLRPTFLLLYRLERGRLHARRGRYRTRRVPAVCKGASPFLFGRESLATLGRTLERRPFGAGGRNRGPVPRASGVRRPTPRFRRGARDAVFFFPVVPSAVVPRASLEIPPPPHFSVPKFYSWCRPKSARRMNRAFGRVAGQCATMQPPV